MYSCSFNSGARVLGEGPGCTMVQLRDSGGSKPLSVLLSCAPQHSLHSIILRVTLLLSAKMGENTIWKCGFATETCASELCAVEEEHRGKTPGRLVACWPWVLCAPEQPVQDKDGRGQT